MRENDRAMSASAKDAFGRNTGFSNSAQQGFSPMDNVEAYDTTPEAKLAMLSKAFKSAPREARRAVFNEAFRMARKSGMKEFELDGKRYTTKLASEVERDAAKKVAEVAIKHIANNEGIVHDATQKEYEMTDMMKQFSYAQPLNTLPVPEDVAERNAIGSAGLDYVSGHANLAGVVGFGSALAGGLASKVGYLSKISQGLPAVGTRNSTIDILRDIAFKKSQNIGEAGRFAVQSMGRGL